MKKFKVTVEDGILHKQTEYEVFAQDKQAADVAMSPLVRSGPYKVVKIEEILDEVAQAVKQINEYADIPCVQDTIKVHAQLIIPTTPGIVTHEPVEDMPVQTSGYATTADLAETDSKTQEFTIESTETGTQLIIENDGSMHETPVMESTPKKSKKSKKSKK